MNKYQYMMGAMLAVLILQLCLIISELTAQSSHYNEQKVVQTQIDGHDYLVLVGKAIIHSAACAKCTMPVVDLLNFGEYQGVTNARTE